MITKTVHFTTTGEFLTDHLRQLWAEGRYKAAFDLLDCLNGLPKEIGFGVIMGSHRLTQNEEGYYSTEDNWNPKSEYSSIWPNPNNLAELAEKGAKYDNDISHWQDWAVAWAKNYIKEGKSDLVNDAIWFLMNHCSQELLARHDMKVVTMVPILQSSVDTRKLVFGSNEKGWSTVYGFRAGIVNDLSANPKKASEGNFITYVNIPINQFWSSYICYLDITTFIGTSAIGAEHWYGKLKYRGDEVELKYKLSQRLATKLNKKSGHPGLYRKGSKYSGYWDRDKLVEQAVNEYKSHFPNSKVLVEGDRASLGPFIVLDGPEELKKEAKRLYLLAEELGWWNKKENDKTMDEIAEQWERLISYWVDETSN